MVEEADYRLELVNRMAVHNKLGGLDVSGSH